MSEFAKKLSENNTMSDKAIKAVVGGLASLAITTLVDRGYDRLIVARRIKDALS